MWYDVPELAVPTRAALLGSPRGCAVLDTKRLPDLTRSCASLRAVLSFSGQNGNDLWDRRGQRPMEGIRLLHKANKYISDHNNYPRCKSWQSSK